MFEDPWPDRPSRIKTMALILAPLLLVGVVGYRYLVTASPVTSAEALEVFRADKGYPNSAAGVAETTSVKSDGSRPAKKRATATRHRDRTRREVPSAGPIAAAGRERSSRAAAPQRARSEETSQPRTTGWQPGAPEEGVYRWDTEGYESFNGARRQFPSRTHRIITLERRNTWTNHHVFSRERESWTRTRAEKDGYYTLYARNRIVFGPVTRDAEVTFDPPMWNNPVGDPIGTTWEGKWDGKTYGTYEGRLLGEDTVRIEGEEVDVIVLELRLRMHGEVEGTSVMRFWVSSRHHMVVREHYRQDATSGAAEYHAEWVMTIESLRPRR